MRTLFKVLAFGCIAATLFTACKKEDDPVANRKIILQKYMIGETENFYEPIIYRFQHDYQHRLSLITATSEGYSIYGKIKYGIDDNDGFSITYIDSPDYPSKTFSTYYFTPVEKGRIIAADWDDRSNLLQYSMYYEYDSKGHLCKFTQKRDELAEIYYFKWKNGELAKVYSEDKSIVYEYTPGDVKYAHALPESANPYFLPEPLMASLGYYGTAPKHFPKKMTITDKNASTIETHEYGYTVMSGLLVEYTDKKSVNALDGTTKGAVIPTYGKLEWLEVE